MNQLPSPRPAVSVLWWGVFGNPGAAVPDLASVNCDFEVAAPTC